MNVKILKKIKNKVLINPKNCQKYWGKQNLKIKNIGKKFENEKNEKTNLKNQKNCKKIEKKKKDKIEKIWKLQTMTKKLTKIKNSKQ